MLFFSLMDYKNNLFSSNDPNKIAQFYESFEERDELIEWMRERHKGKAQIIEFDSDSSIVVVIPTSDINGTYSKNCRESIFKGFRLIFVTSGDFKDPYFNYAHCINVGLKKAMEYNPKWIVISDDDMIKIDEPAKLSEEISKVEEDSDVLFAKMGTRHSKLAAISDMNFVGNFLNRVIYALSRARGKEIGFTSWESFQNKIFNKYRVTYRTRPNSFVFWDLFYHRKTFFIVYSSFVIFRAEFIKNRGEEYLDETFVNGYEDQYLSLEIKKKNVKYRFIDFAIEDAAYGTLGTGSIPRIVRDFCNGVYFDDKIKSNVIFGGRIRN